MSYILKEITIQSYPSKEAQDVVSELWHDIETGKLPLLFDSTHHFQQGLSPITKYSHYASDLNHPTYDLTIQGVTPEFFEEMEKAVSNGLYKKYDISDSSNDLTLCSQKAWAKVSDEQETHVIHRSFTTDYESTVPSQYTKDGIAHCYLYIALAH